MLSGFELYPRWVPLFRVAPAKRAPSVCLKADAECEARAIMGEAIDK